MNTLMYQCVQNWLKILLFTPLLRGSNSESKVIPYRGGMQQTPLKRIHENIFYLLIKAQIPFLIQEK